MAEKRIMTRNQNDDDDGASSSNLKRHKTWSDLNHDLLRLVMMQLGVADYYSFRRVCKSWGSLACENENTFIASRPPMSMKVNHHCRALMKSCNLKDLEGRKFKTMLPWFSAFENCIGLTCGYLIFFTKLTRDFWLVNPITRKQLHFPDFPFDHHPRTREGRPILVFSLTFSRLVFVVLSTGHRGGGRDRIYYHVKGEGAWNCVPYHRSIIDLYAFKGKIYTLTCGNPYQLCELRLGPQPKLILLETKKTDLFYPGVTDFFYPDEFVSYRESLYVKCRTRDDSNSLLELDFSKMEWVKPCEKTLEKYALFCCYLNRVVAVKRESWDNPRSFERYADTRNSGKISVFTTKMWYFPHECMKVDRIDE